MQKFQKLISEICKLEKLLNAIYAATENLFSITVVTSLH